MAMGFTWALMFLFFGGDMAGDLLKAPPRDFASLVDPVAALAGVGVETDADGRIAEDTLIGLVAMKEAGEPDLAALRKAVEELGAAEFATRQAARQQLQAAGAAAKGLLETAAQSDDPEVRLTARELLAEIKEEQAAAEALDMDYAKKLLAVRALERLGSEKALPALQAAAQTGDVTLADAAGEAIAAIKGEDSPRPSGKEAMAWLASHTPEQTAVFVVGDFSRGASDRTLANVLDSVLEAGRKNPGAMRLMGMQIEHAEAAMTGVKKGADGELVQALAKTGNFRVDAAAMVIPSGWTDNPDYMWIAWVFRGLYDPVRMGRFLAAEMGRNRDDAYREVLGVPVYGRRYDPNVCLLDKNTMAVVVGDVDRAEMSEPIIRALKGQPLEDLPPAVVDAMAQFKREGETIRIAAGGRMFLSPSLLDEGRRELGGAAQRENAQPPRDLEDRFEGVFIRFALALLDLQEAGGYLTDAGLVRLRGVSKDNPAAMLLSASLKDLNQILVDVVKQMSEGANEEVKKMVEVLADGPGNVAAEGNEVTLEFSIPALLKSISLVVLNEIQDMAAGARQDPDRGATIEVAPMPAR